MELDRKRLIERRAAMRAAGHWRDETLLDHLVRSVARSPDKPAIVAKRSEGGEETRPSYRELDRISDLVALSLWERGVGRGDVVSFQLPNWWEFSVLQHGHKLVTIPQRVGMWGAGGEAAEWGAPVCARDIRVP